MDNGIRLTDPRISGVYEHDGMALRLKAICYFKDVADILASTLRDKNPQFSYHVMPLLRLDSGDNVHYPALEELDG